MGGADEGDAEVHPEEEHLEELRLRERQHRDPGHVGQRASGQDLHRETHYYSWWSNCISGV